MDVKQIYEQKLCSAEEAVSIVKSGDWIDYGWCSGHPRVLDEALAARHEELHEEAGYVFGNQPSSMSQILQNILFGILGI